MSCLPLEPQATLFIPTWYSFALTLKENVSVTQFATWISIFLFLVTLYASFAMFYMDLDQDSDTILYAKFLTRVEDRR